MNTNIKPNDSQELSLITAAKCVVALSGWSTLPDGRQVFQSSFMAIQTLRKAIEEHENPVLRLAPEPMPRGL